MKKILFLLLSCIPMLSTAQTLTEVQKQEALQSATKFCNLLKRFCEGERTLDTQIYGLCSGADCSAYDEIRTNSEKTLRNYLLAIQTKYPGKLLTSISSPTFSKSKTYIEPVVDISMGWGNVDGTDMSTTQMLSVTQEDINNIYVVFDILQGFPSSGKSLDKKIIYSLKTKKIVAFITSDGSYLSFLNGTMALTNKDYKNALRYFEAATGNERSSMSKKSYGLALYCCIMLEDYEKAIIYAEQFNDPLYLAFVKVAHYSLNNKIEEAHPYAVQLENLISQRKDISNVSKTNMYKMLATVYLSPSSYQSYGKGLSFLKKADALGDAGAGYAIFVYCTIFHDDFIPLEDAIGYLEKSAHAGFPPAFYQMGRFEEFGYEDKDEALSWYLKASQAGNHIGMAGAGKILIEKGEKQRGLDLLKKALEGDALERQLYDCEMTTGGLAPWPKSRADVQTLLNKYNESSSYQTITNSTTNVSTSGNTTSYNNSSSNSNTTVHSSTSSYSHRRHREFNKNLNVSDGALSVGYVQKQWVYDTDGMKEKFDVMGEDEYTNGIQAGIRLSPQFKYGFGLNMGLYYEYYFDKSEDMYDDGLEYNFKSEEHCLYLPIHLKYNLNFSKWFQLGVYGGIGLGYGLSGKIYARSNGETLDSFGLYDDGLDMKRFNTSLEYGASLRINNFEINFSISNGLINMSDSEDYKVKLNKPLNISASWYL